MDQASLESLLADLHLPAIRSFATIDSTNDEAWRWIDTGALSSALVVADEQIAGRGRLHRRWITLAGSSLAFSLIYLSPPLEPRSLSLLNGLGALATCQALNKLYSLHALIKWPNDILLDQRKTGGVLVEARWNGMDLKAAVIGIGINIAPESINPDVLTAETLSFPVTCVENAVGNKVDRLELLHSILEHFFGWFPRLSSQDFLRAWEETLAYRSQWVELTYENSAQSSSLIATPPSKMIGQVIGLAANGSLRLRTNSGKLVTAQVGEIHLRPTPNPPPG